MLKAVLLREMKRALERILDWTPVLVALPLYAVALSWGWDPEQLWSWDEPRPVAIVASPYAVGASWPAHYPLLHRDLLRVWFGIVDPVAGLFGVQGTIELDRVRFLAGRALTLLLALGTVRLAYLVARDVAARGARQSSAPTTRPAEGRRAGVIAAFAWLAVLPQTYYAKTMNLEGPYLFWAALAIWAFVRLRAEPRARFSWLFFGAATAAVLTKDQAFGLFVLPMFLLLGDALRGRWQAAGPRPALRLLGGPMLGAALVAAASYRLAGGGELLRRHLEALLGVPGTYAFTAPGLTSASDRALLALHHVAWSFGGPLAIVVAAGLVLALLSRRAAGAARAAHGCSEPAVLLLFPLSYFLFALLPLGYNYDRFLLPVCWVFAVVAGSAISNLLERLGAPGGRILVAVAVAGAVAWGIWRCVALDRAMAGDRRYALEAATRGDRRVALARFAVRAPHGFDRAVLAARGELPLDLLSPYELVAVPVRDLGDFHLSRLTRKLADGACGFHRVYPEVGEPSELGRFIEFDGVLSNLAEVDPPLALFRRDPPIGPCPAR